MSHNAANLIPCSSITEDSSYGNCSMMTVVFDILIGSTLGENMFLRHADFMIRLPRDDIHDSDDDNAGREASH
jgi:hypothetical protein